MTVGKTDEIKQELARKVESTKAGTKLKKSMSIADMIKVMEPQIKKALPEVITPERFTRMALSALNTTPKLNECTPMSFLAALMNAAQLGLEPNTPLGQAFLIPYNNKGEMECQFQLGYKGLIDLSYRNPNMQIITAHTVYENDEFEYELGLNPCLNHRPTLGERGEIRLEILGDRRKVDVHKVIEPWEVMKSGVNVEVINYEWNQERLKKEKMVYEKILDLAIVFTVNLREDKDFKMTITSGLLEQWKITKDELISVAYENFAKADYAIISYEDVMEQLLGLRIESELCVLLNRSKLRGASGMLRIDLLQDLADKKESDLLILPSSVNEVLLLAEEDNILDMDSVKKMVEDINRDYVDEEERLSDNIYTYKRKTGKISIWNSEEMKCE